MKTFRLASLLAALAMGAGLSAQTISGRLVDEQNLPMPYANVVLLSLPDSAYVTGVVSREDGSFQLKNPTGEERLLRISSVGYVSIYNRCTSGEVGTFRLEPDAALLGEVVVKGTLPVTRMKDRARPSFISTGGRCATGPSWTNSRPRTSAMWNWC